MGFVAIIGWSVISVPAVSRCEFTWLRVAAAGSMGLVAELYRKVYTGPNEAKSVVSLQLL
jgi:hypothetical protein